MSDMDRHELRPSWSSRRAFLVGSAGAVAGVAGCLGGGGDDDADDGGTSNDDGGTSNDDGGTSNDDGGTSNDDGGTSNDDGGANSDEGGDGQDDSNDWNGDPDDDAGPEAVIAWNRQLLDVIRLTGETSTQTVRRIAILTTSMFDAVTTVTAAREQTHYESYGSYDDDPPAEASRVAALGGAAHEALVEMYPGFTSAFDDRLDETLAAAEQLDGDVGAGEEWGRTVGGQTVQERADDGHDEPEPGGYDPCPDQTTEETPGCWRGGSLGTWSSSHYAFLDTWVLDDPLEFEGPPGLETEAYAEDWQEVYDLGDDRNREERSQEQVDIARYWRGGAGTTRPSGRWLRIANIAAESGEFDLSMLETARLMAIMGLSIGDAGVTTWNGKHTHGHWRPAEAIEFGDTDGNPDTFADPEWESIAIGSSPEYPAGLACYGGAGKTVLVEVLGTDEFAFEMTSSGPPELTRSFESFSDAMEESWMSRLYVGNHFRSSLEDGVAAGEEIAQTVVETELQPVE